MGIIKQKIKLFLLKRKFKKSYINSHQVSLNSIIGTEVSISSDVLIGENVVIGDFTYINSDTRINSAKIGKFCSISYGCKIGLSEHPTNYISTSPRIYGANNILNETPFYEDYKEPPIIENDVWIGANAIILQGVKIGNGSIVGAGALVTKDVAPYSIVGGVPAIKIKDRFTLKQINYLNKLKWWDKSTTEIIKMKKIFLEKDKWVKS